MITYWIFSSYSQSASYIRQDFRVSLNMSEHLHSHAEPHSCSLSEHSLQFELGSTAPSFPLSLSIYPQPPCACPDTKSLLQPTPFCGRLPDVHPHPSLSLPRAAPCAQPSYPALPTTTLLYPTQHIFGSFLTILGTFQDPVLKPFPDIYILCFQFGQIA